MLQFGKVKINARALLLPISGIVQEIHREIEEAGGSELAVYFEMFLAQMPTAGTDKKCGNGFVERIFFAFRAGEINGAADSIANVNLSIKRSVPGWRMGILEICHIAVCAGVEGVDDHFAIDRSGDFDTAVLQISGDGLDPPIALANGLSFWKKARHF